MTKQARRDSNAHRKSPASANTSTAMHARMFTNQRVLITHTRTQSHNTYQCKYTYMYQKRGSKIFSLLHLQRFEIKSTLHCRSGVRSNAAESMNSALFADGSYPKKHPTLSQWRSKQCCREHEQCVIRRRKLP